MEVLAHRVEELRSQHEHGASWMARRAVEALLDVAAQDAATSDELLHTPPAFVTCTATAPHEEGRALAEELREAGLEVEVVSDEEAEAALERSTLLLLGADTIFVDGAVCNRAGTRRLAEVADSYGVPTVVAAEAIKLTPIPAAEAPALDPESAALFDVTPPELVDAIVTEEGTVEPDGVGALVNRIPFLVDGFRLLRGES